MAVARAGTGVRILPPRLRVVLILQRAPKPHPLPTFTVAAHHSSACAPTFLASTAHICVCARIPHVRANIPRISAPMSLAFVRQYPSHSRAAVPCVCAPTSLALARRRPLHLRARVPSICICAPASQASAFARASPPPLLSVRIRAPHVHPACCQESKQLMWILLRIFILYISKPIIHEINSLFCLCYFVV